MMTIQIGDKIPSVTLQQMQKNAVIDITTEELFEGKKVIVFGLPGAFTPTCSVSHLPGYVVKSDEIFAKGIDSIICISVNDAFVMAAWGEQHNVDNRVMMIADGSANFTRTVGLDLDLIDRGMGVRSQRYAMVINNGIVEMINIEAPGKFEVSDAETVLNSL